MLYAFNFSTSDLLTGFHTGEQYSKAGLTNVKYRKCKILGSLNSFEYRVMQSSVRRLLFIISLTWSLKLKSLENKTPRSRMEFVVSNLCDNRKV